MIIFSNSLNPDNILFDILMVFLKEFFEKIYFEKCSEEFPSMQRVN